MKKLLSVLLALVMVLGLATTALAAESTPSFEKNYHVINTDTTAPAEDFLFLIEPVAFKGYDTGVDVALANFPKPTGAALGNTFTDRTDLVDNSYYLKASFTTALTGSGTANGTTNVDVAFADGVFSAAGRYIYKLTEQKSGTAGVTIGKGATTDTSTDIDSYLVVYVVHGTGNDAGKYVYQAAFLHESYDSATDVLGSKEDGFDNMYEATGDAAHHPSCSFAVKKEVYGDIGDKKHDFDIQVSITAKETVKEDITFIDGCTEHDAANNTATYIGGKWTIPADEGWTGTKTVTIHVHDQETVQFINIPTGVKVAVTESSQTVNSKNYTVEYAYKNGTADETPYTKGTEIVITSGNHDTVIVKNTLNSETPTGVVLDNLPYIVLLAVAAAGLFLLMTKKRQTSED